MFLYQAIYVKPTRVISITRVTMSRMKNIVREGTKRASRNCVTMYALYEVRRELHSTGTRQ